MIIAIYNIPIYLCNCYILYYLNLLQQVGYENEFEEKKKDAANCWLIIG